MCSGPDEFVYFGAAAPPLPEALESNELWRYREMARSLEELELGDVLPLDQAIPELGSLGQSMGQTLGQNSGERPAADENTKLLN